MPLDTHRDRKTVVIEAEYPLLVLCDLMLQVLDRDNALRSAYAQRRWQALLPNTPGVPIHGGVREADHA